MGKVKAKKELTITDQLLQRWDVQPALLELGSDPLVLSKFKNYATLAIMTNLPNIVKELENPETTLRSKIAIMDMLKEYSNFKEQPTATNTIDIDVALDDELVKQAMDELQTDNNK